MTDHAIDTNPTEVGPLLVPGKTRIRDADGFVGTVVYAGPVASAKNPNEIYAGISWDDTSRGKHDGSVLCRSTNQVVRHFHCGPTQGSFLRLSKLDRGVTLTLELLQSKYVEMQAPVIAPNNILPHTARTSSGKDKPIEFLGELQIRGRQQLEDIFKVSLRREGISRSDLSAQAGKSEFFSNIHDVDLAGNLLSDWGVVVEIIRQFPCLTDFSVAFNRIQDVCLPVLEPPLTNVKVLNLNHCGIESFESVLWVAKSMPSLVSLCVASADLSDMNQHSTLDGFLPSLRVLDCTNCKISSWDKQIQPYFGSLPLLEQLSLDENPIPRIEVDGYDCFVALKSLQLAATIISSWNDVDGVTRFKSLQALRLKSVPLTANLGQGEVRFLAIARIPALHLFNGSVVSLKERTEAERRYVTMIAHLLLKVEREHVNETAEKLEKAKTRVMADHPQYAVLLETHKGLILPASSGQSGGGDGLHKSSLASSVCNITISSMSSSSCSMEPLTKRLPGTLTVGRVKALCARSFGLDIDLMSLHFRTEVSYYWGGRHNSLDYANLRLGWHSNKLDCLYCSRMPSLLSLTMMTTLYRIMVSAMAPKFL